MSVGCFECCRVGDMDHAIVFVPNGRWDMERPVSKYTNVYVCRRHLPSPIAEVESSSFMIVQFSATSVWNTGSDGELLKECKQCLVDEADMQHYLPRTLAYLVKDDACHGERQRIADQENTRRAQRGFWQRVQEAIDTFSNHRIVVVDGWNGVKVVKPEA